MEICSSCLTPKSRPRIIFVNGVCNACINSETKKTINWKKRKEEFLIKADEMKKYAKDNNNCYHCIVPWSGGKDSSSIALKLKKNFDLNPLLVTFSPLIQNECGQHNRKILLDEGFDSIMFSPNGNISRKLSFKPIPLALLNINAIGIASYRNRIFPSGEFVPDV